MDLFYLKYMNEVNLICDEILFGKIHMETSACIVE